MTNLRIENTGGGTVNLDTQVKKNGRWESKGIRRLSAGSSLNLTGAGTLRLFATEKEVARKGKPEIKEVEEKE